MDWLETIWRRIAAVIIRCNPCGKSVTVQTFAVPAPLCNYCGARDWSHLDEPAKVYPQTADDRKFLRSLRIAADDDQVDRTDYR